MRNLTIKANVHTDPLDPRNTLGFKSRIRYPENRHISISEASREDLFLEGTDTPRKNVLLCRPVFMHKHSEPTLNLEPFIGVWAFETSQLGFMFTGKGDHSKGATEEDMLEDMNEHIAALNAWFHGDVYTLTVEDQDEKELIEFDLYGTGKAMRRTIRDLQQVKNVFPAGLNFRQLVIQALDEGTAFIP